jgi:hypothetical protein
VESQIQIYDVLHAYFMVCVFAPMWSRMGVLSLLETKIERFFCADRD